MLSLNNTLPTISVHQRISFVSTIFAQKRVIFRTMDKNQRVLLSSSQQTENSSSILSCKASLEVVHDSPR